MVKLLLIAGLFFGVALNAGAQVPVFKNYNTSDGLPSSETYNSIQDEKGYIWIGTDRGIVRFDGYRFKVYTTAEGLPDNTVFEFFKAGDGKLWFKTFSSEIGYIENDSIYSYKYNHIFSTLFPNQFITSMFVEHGEIVFVSNTPNVECKIYKIDKNGHLDSITRKNNSVKNIYVKSNGFRVNDGLQSAKQTEVLLYESGKRLGSFSSQKSTANTFITPLKKSDGFCLFADHQVFLFKNGRFRKILDCGNDVISLHSDNEDNIWIGYLHGGLECYSIESGYKNAFTFLEKYSVSSINQDYEGGFWFTTLESGIFYMAPSALVSFTEAEGLPGTSVKKVLSVEDKMLVIMSDNSVLIKEKNSGFKTILKENAHYVDLVCGADGTLYRTNYMDFNIQAKAKVVNAGYAKKIVTGRDKVYSIDPGRIEVFDKAGKLLKLIRPNKLPRIITVCEQINGDLLIGTLRGAFLYSGDTAISLKAINPLYGSRISEIKQLNKNHIIFTTIGNGLFIIKNNEYSKPLHYTDLHGLPGTMCNDAVMVNDTITWVATNRGLCCVKNILDPSKAAFITLDINNGIASNEINQICFTDSSLWLATTKGITIVPAFSLPPEIPAIPLYIEGISVNGKIIENAARLSLSHLENNINIFFTGLHFQHTGKLLYKYRMKGDKNWNYTTSRSVVYSALPPGNYTFELGVVKPTGKENPLLAHYSFTILPPVWKTWWFLVLLVFTAALGIYLFINYRVQFVRNREQLNTELDRFRDKALRDQMNPHFIYNSLNSIQNFILKNDTLESAAFLSKFSRLMRLIFNHTGQDRVTIEKDLEALLLYSELENLRFPNKFTLYIDHNLGSDVSRITIPPLIFQPFVENAILHGLLTKNSPGNIRLTIIKQPDCLEISMADDGIGRQAAAEVSKRKAKYFPPKEPAAGKTRTSGITATMERIEQAWRKKAGKSNFKVIDLRDENNSPQGTTIQFCLPIDYD